MTRNVRYLVLLGWLCLEAHPVFGQSATATQLVRFEVRSVAQIVVSGNPGGMVILRSPDGTLHNMASDGSTSYSIVTNAPDMKISASLDSPMPPGTSLLIRLGSTRGKSRGDVDLSGAKLPAEVVSGISCGRDANQRIVYTFLARPDVQELPAETRMVTLTLTD